MAAPLRNFIHWLSTKKALTDAIARRGMRHGFARRFVAGETLAEALTASEELNAAGCCISLNHLGENVTTEEEARRVKDTYLGMLGELAAHEIDGNISIKLTQLGLDIDPDLSQTFVAEICEAAKAIGRDIEVDMEGSDYTDITLDIFEATRRKHDNVGVAIQAYLYRTESDIERLKPLAPKIRLVKGAYREPAKIAYQRKEDVNSNYRRLVYRLLSGGYFPAIATHNEGLLYYALELIRLWDIGPDRYEFQMIYGIRRDLQQQLHEQDHTLRVYVPFGADWCPYFMRRLAERPANCAFVLRSIATEALRRHKTS